MSIKQSKLSASNPSTNSQSFKNVVLAIHGGAGVMTREAMTEAHEKRYLKHLEAALKAGFKSLQEHGSSLDAVEEAVRYLENCPIFNAGRGSVLTHDGTIELDAAIMDGCDRMAGAIASVTNIKNPITAARAVMEQSPHVLLVGKGAEKFARKFGLELVEPAYFHTDHQHKHLQQVLKGTKKEKRTLKKFGTVGAVAVDDDKHLAAATSTGGMVNKRYGRVGDSPLIGAGTYADNNTCAVSATGHGEFFIRYLAAYDVSALMKYGKLSLADAANRVIHETLVDAGGEGGLIAIDGKGNCALPFNSQGMFRGCITKDGEVFVAIYGD